MRTVNTNVHFKILIPFSLGAQRCVCVSPVVPSTALENSSLSISAEQRRRLEGGKELFSTRLPHFAQSDAEPDTGLQSKL